MKEHVRLVLWPRDKVNGLSRYVVVGMVVTDKPVFDGENEVVIDADTHQSVSNILAELPRSELVTGSGTADNLLASLSWIFKKTGV